MFRYSRWSTSSFARWCCVGLALGHSEGQISNAVSTIVSHTAEAKPRGWLVTASDSHPDGGRSAALPSCASSHGELLPPRCPRLSPSSPSPAPPPPRPIQRLPPLHPLALVRPSLLFSVRLRSFGAASTERLVFRQRANQRPSALALRNLPAYPYTQRAYLSPSAYIVALVFSASWHLQRDEQPQYLVRAHYHPALHSSQVAHRQLGKRRIALLVPPEP